MYAILRWLLGLVVTVTAMLFAIANRARVPVSWSPVNLPAPVPVYALALGGAVIGFLVGGALVWLNAAETRRERRRQRRHITKLEQRLEGPGRE